MASDRRQRETQLFGHWPFSLCHALLGRPIPGIATALLLVGTALGVRLMMGDPAPAPLLAYYPAIVIATFLGGRIAGYSATVLAWVLAWYMFVRPSGGVELRDGAGIALLVFVPSTVIVLEVVHALCTSAMDLIAAKQHLERDGEWQAEQRAHLLGVIDELQAIYDEAPVGLGLLDADLRFARINSALAEMNGFTPEDHIGRNVWDLLPDLRASAEPLLRTVLEGGEVMRGVEISGETPARPGVKRTWSEVFYPVHGPDGQRRGVGIFCVEITDLKQAREREDLLTREVDHRAKNLLAVVQSIVQMMKAQGSVAEFKEALIGRIAAISRAHSHLSENRWDGVKLQALIADELTPYGIAVDLDPVVNDLVLKSSTAQAMAMVLHELATNSAKYGALSANGSVEVLCRATALEEEALVMQWRESGGPSVTAPKSRGFGTRLIERSVTHGIGGKLDYRFLPEGVFCRISIPRSALG
ncbi:sensor histidine kinase [Novosphingobium taihuense]|uniref:histidine kinase n=1 Tax=Novosphingobium taihuense TaxID=260085 RepID=A0A7W7ETQ4_9SPHN|nr:HWE histidine kinase domain-containing protein [Novosphingobium taihuense]MBB4613487.1 PAS domain S-box-containing protein [Novosphingobium taihuense]TWH79966.1 PAS domain S-box-containing protein [Novosphingobium taihuense]